MSYRLTFVRNLKILTLQIHICKIFMFLGGQELGLEIEIGTGILGLGLQSPWQTGEKKRQFNHICIAYTIGCDTKC